MCGRAGGCVLSEERRHMALLFWFSTAHAFPFFLTKLGRFTYPKAFSRPRPYFFILLLIIITFPFFFYIYIYQKAEKLDIPKIIPISLSLSLYYIYIYIYYIKLMPTFLETHISTPLTPTYINQITTHFYDIFQKNKKVVMIFYMKCV